MNAKNNIRFKYKVVRANKVRTDWALGALHQSQADFYASVFSPSDRDSLPALATVKQNLGRPWSKQGTNTMDTKNYYGKFSGVYGLLSSNYYYHNARNNAVKELNLKIEEYRP